MSNRIPSPAIVCLGGSWLLPLDNAAFVSHWGVLDRVAPQYRYRRAIARDLKLDLLVYASRRGVPVVVGVLWGKRPFPLFPTALAEDWLAAGGREWVLAELEARAGTRVVAFPRRAPE